MRPQKPEITLDLLCNELLMNIRGYIDDDDLLALVCWHNVSTRFQDFLEDYDSIDCTYWQRLCHLNGLGCWEGDDGDEEEDGATWSLFALDCACHAWRCKHPNCGRALLRDNGTHLYQIEEWLLFIDSTVRCVVQAMRDVMVAYPEWDPLDVLEHEDRYSDSDGPDNMTIELTTSFEDIGFALNRDESIRWPWDRSIAYLRSPDEDVCQIPSEDKVEFHEIMMRTFATFPPCKRICYLNLDVMSETENSLGVTVSNVLETVKDWYVVALLTVRWARPHARFATVLLSLYPRKTLSIYSVPYVGAPGHLSSLLDGRRKSYNLLSQPSMACFERCKPSYKSYNPCIRIDSASLQPLGWHRLQIS